MSENLILFDPFETLGSEVAASPRKRLADFDVDPSARVLLSALARRALLGVLAFDPRVRGGRLRALLKSKGLIPPLARELVAVAHDANPFAQLLEKAGLSADRAVFVSLEAVHRARALDAGLRVAPHPALAAAVLDGESLHYVRLSARDREAHPDWASLLGELAAVPVFRAHEPEPVLYAIASRSAIDALRNAGPIGVRERGEPDLPARTTLVLFQVTPDQVGPGVELQDFLGPGSQTPNGWLAALRADRALADVHPPPEFAGHGHTRVLLPHTSLLRRPARVVVGAPRRLVDAELKQLRKLDGVVFRKQLEALLRVSVSRHFNHAGNDKAVTRLKATLKGICGSAHLRGRHDNVVAEIKGRTNELVVIGAHLDSTAQSDRPYNPKIDPAPGADDDGSGVTAVLEVARVLKRLARRKKPQRTIRFVLFNAEEQGLVGSAAYAHYLKEYERAPVVEMLAMDMIGWHPVGGKPRFAFEIHRGTDHKEAQQGSGQLAKRLKKAARNVAPRLEPQVSPLDGTDPASGKSDHSSFHFQRWPACLLSEDMWVGVVPKPGSNPNYHKAKDLPESLSFDYAADIARVVAAVAWLDANP